MQIKLRFTQQLNFKFFFLHANILPIYSNLSKNIERSLEIFREITVRTFMLDGDDHSLKVKDII